MSVDVYVIGGFVRDIFLKRNSKDIDIVVVGSGIKLAQKVAAKIENNTKVKVFKNFGTAMLRYKDIELEFVGARRESYSNDSRKPFVEDGTLEDDQNRRDFTINALALSLHKDRFGELVDPFNGIEHLEAKLIKTPLDPNITFSDDPLRIMRAIRFATQLNFTIDEECFEAIKNNVDRLKIVSGERIADELNKIILSKKPSYGFKLLDESGILALIFPEFLKLKGVDFVENIGHKDNFQHTLKVLDKVADKSNNLWLRWAAILHDIGKPITKKYIKGIGWTFHTHEFVGSKMVYRIFKNLKLPLNEKMRYVQKLVQLHLRPIALVESHVTDSAIRRLLFDAGDDVDDLMTLCKADITSKNQKKVEKFVNNFELVKQKLIEIEEKDKLRNWQPPISGNEIMEFFHIQPCKEVGIIKNAIREAILDGNLENNYEDARNYMIAEGEKLGLLSKK
ncbi:MAG: CCA tRNA nucleotidyltransferase [Saprospiraceae bacterium]|nr:CCA tRNA nucleotidyltransferase [Saprospiraceae bacterium]